MIVTDYLSYKEALRIITHSTLLAFDVETTGLNTRSDKVIGLGVSNGNLNSFYLPLLKWNGSELIDMPFKSKCKEMLELLKGKKLIAHNAQFDIEMIRNNLGVDLWDSLYCDTIMLVHTVQENGPFGLKKLASSLFGVDELEEQTAMKESIKNNGGSSNEFYKADTTLMGKYCEKDCQMTIKIYKHYSKLLEAEGLEDFFYKDEVIPLYKLVTKTMQSRGVPLDLPLLMQTQTEINVDIEKLETEIQLLISDYTEGTFKTYYLNKEYPAKNTGEFVQSMIELYSINLPKIKSGKYSMSKKHVDSLPDNIHTNFIKSNSNLDSETKIRVQLNLLSASKVKYIFNLSSKHHLGKLFFEHLKERSDIKTPTGRDQVNDEFLDKMALKYEWVSKLQVYNKLIKIRGTYIERFLEKQEGGIFYPQFKQHGTISGRYGSDLQQLNKPYEQKQLDSGEIDSRVFKYSNLVRKFFIAGEGYSLIDNDYESLEPHVFAHVSGDDGLKEIFKHGYDFYSTIAIKTEKLHNVSADKKAANYLGLVDKTKRNKSKSYSLGVPYGMGDYALSKNLDIPQNTAAQLIRDYLEAFPNLNKWYLESAEFVKKNGYIKSEAGRVRHLPDAKKYFHLYGDELLDSLDLWQKYNSTNKYTEMKEKRNKYKNAINNARNFQIQSLAASIVNRAAIKIQEYINENNLDAYVCAQIHDQLIIRCKDEIAEHMKNKVQEIMETAYKISIDLKAPAQIAKDFYEGH